MGRPFSSIWKLFGTMSMPCVVPEMLWSLDELKRVLISEFPILETEEGEGFKILFDLFVEWAEILLNYNNQHPLALLNLGNCGPESFSQGISGRAYSCRIALEGCHRTPEDPIAPQRTPSHPICRTIALPLSHHCDSTCYHCTCYVVRLHPYIVPLHPLRCTIVPPTSHHCTLVLHCITVPLRCLDYTIAPTLRTPVPALRTL